MSAHVLTVTFDEAGQRLDVMITRRLPEEIPSRMFAKRIIEAGRVQLNGKPCKARDMVQERDQVLVEILFDDYPDERIHPEDIPLDILYEDESLIAINKPSGMSVHPAAGRYGGTLVNALVHHVQTLSDVNGPKRPGIVHRLDKETSGVILAARTNAAHVHLGRQFEQHTIEKRYVALVQGVVQYDEGMIEAGIARHAKYHDMRRIAREGEEAKEATTYYTVIRRHKGCTLVALFPRTGRTHQLRLHMRHVGHPILGDDKYGQKGSFPRLALHAQAIHFVHPLLKEPLEIWAPLPEEFREYA
ncbi:MAG: RluA family pseudouridine synthase [Elusimicrobia bacterium]|nr:RluA family pseudouridine synthase [Elusimicrobiota bacterium]